MNIRFLTASTLLIGLTALGPAQAQMMPMRPPAFMGGIPGLAQMQATFNQRHQSRTALYREALEELRKNPKAADVPDCPVGQRPSGQLCLQQPAPPPLLPSDAASTEVPPQASALPSSATPQAITPPIAPPPPRKLAVLFGNNDYKMPIPALETPIADVTDISRVLRGRLGFETRIVANASKAQIIDAINQVAAEVQPGDSVLLLYAGHGYLMDENKMGYWIPVDGSVKSPANWISNSDISKLLKAIPAHQVILVSDSCFSGSLTKEQKISTGAKPNTEALRKQRSVLALSSGDEEPVSDEGKEGHSIFAYNLIKTLETARGLTPGYEIYRIVHGNVSKEYPQTPQYGAVTTAGHSSGGEYLFEAAP